MSLQWWLARPGLDAYSNSWRPLTTPPTPRFPINPQSLLGISSNEEEAFHLFPYFPSEIRSKIWRHSLPAPHILHVLHDCHYNWDHPIWFNDQRFGRHGDWVILNPITALDLAPQLACKEAYVEGKLLGVWEKTVAGWGCDYGELGESFINYETDIVFYNTNSPDPERPYNDVRAGDPGEPILPPVYRFTRPCERPLDITVLQKLKYVAVAENLWYHWSFIEYYGSEVDCSNVNHCPTYRRENIPFNFRRDIIRHTPKLERLQIVQDLSMVYTKDDFFLRFREPTREHEVFSEEWRREEEADVNDPVWLLDNPYIHIGLAIEEDYNLAGNSERAYKKLEMVEFDREYWLQQLARRKAQDPDFDNFSPKPEVDSDDVVTKIACLPDEKNIPGWNYTYDKNGRLRLVYVALTKARSLTSESTYDDDYYQRDAWGNRHYYQDPEDPRQWERRYSYDYTSDVKKWYNLTSPFKELEPGDPVSTSSQLPVETRKPVDDYWSKIFGRNEGREEFEPEEAYDSLSGLFEDVEEEAIV